MSLLRPRKDGRREVPPLTEKPDWPLGAESTAAEVPPLPGCSPQRGARLLSLIRGGLLQIDSVDGASVAIYKEECLGHCNFGGGGFSYGKFVEFGWFFDPFPLALLSCKPLFLCLDLILLGVDLTT